MKQYVILKKINNVPNINNNKENNKEMELPKDHKPIGMM